MALVTKVARVNADGIEIFYRHAGEHSKPILLLLHGYPSSSHQFRNLIPLLSNKYHVIAPDLPGFGFTHVPTERNYKYTFDNAAISIEAFLDALKITSYSVYMFDYGAPVAERLALSRPESIQAIITQNGNAYDEGLGDWWAPLRGFWASSNGTSEREAVAKAALVLESVKEQYDVGSPDKDAIQPESWLLDWTLMQQPGKSDIMIDYFYDYQNNLKLYPKFHEYLRSSGVPVLAAWGKRDVCFIPEGAEAFKKDVKDLELVFLDNGHFAIELKEEEFAGLIIGFLTKRGIA